MTKIEPGWRFYSADFSINASGKKDNSLGRVMLIRCPEDKVRWHNLINSMGDDYDVNNAPPLYVYGDGLTLDAAIESANINARYAEPIDNK